MAVSVNALNRAFSSTAVLIEPLLIPDSTFYLEVHAARVYCRRVYVRLVCVCGVNLPARSTVDVV